jgi:hypothetical protein
MGGWFASKFIATSGVFFGRLGGLKPALRANASGLICARDLSLFFGHRLGVGPGGRGIFVFSAETA